MLQRTLPIPNVITLRRQLSYFWPATWSVRTILRSSLPRVLVKQLHLTWKHTSAAFPSLAWPPKLASVLPEISFCYTKWSYKLKIRSHSYETEVQHTCNNWWCFVEAKSQLAKSMLFLKFLSLRQTVFQWVTWCLSLPITSSTWFLAELAFEQWAELLFGPCPDMLSTSGLYSRPCDD